MLIWIHQASWLTIWWAMRRTASRRSTWVYVYCQAQVSVIGGLMLSLCHRMNLHVPYCTSPARPTSTAPCVHLPRLRPWVCQNTLWMPALCASVALRWYQVCRWAHLLRGQSLNTWAFHTESLKRETGSRTHQNRIDMKACARCCTSQSQCWILIFLCFRCKSRKMQCTSLT